MEVQKLVIKVETQQQVELFRMEIPDNMAGRFLAFIGQQLEGIIAQAITPASKD